MALLRQVDSRLAPASRDVTEWQQALTGWLEDERCAVYLAESGHEAAGYMIGWLQAAPPGVMPEHYGMITELALDLHTYHGGIGRQLVEALRGWFASHGVSRFVVYVACRHATEQAFWRALGGREYMHLMGITV